MIHRAAWQITSVILLVVAGDRLIGFVLNGYVFSKLRFNDSTDRTVYLSSAICSSVLLLAVSAFCYYISLRPRQSDVRCELTAGSHHRFWLVLGVRLVAIFLIATAIPKAIGHIAMAMVTSIPEVRNAYVAALAEPLTAVVIGGCLAAIASKYNQTSVQPDNNG